MCDPLGRSSGDALSDTLRGRQPMSEMEIRVYEGDTYFRRVSMCARPSEAAVGFRLNATKASEGVV